MNLNQLTSRGGTILWVTYSFFVWLLIVRIQEWDAASVPGDSHWDLFFRSMACGDGVWVCWKVENVTKTTVFKWGTWWSMMINHKDLGCGSLFSIKPQWSHRDLSMNSTWINLAEELSEINRTTPFGAALWKWKVTSHNYKSVHAWVCGMSGLKMHPKAHGVSSFFPSMAITWDTVFRMRQPRPHWYVQTHLSPHGYITPSV